MTQETFEYIKTAIVNSEEVEKAICDCSNKDYEGAEYPNFRDRLKDGESIIDLYIELGQYLSFQGLTSDDHDDANKEFWSDVEEVLVEPKEKRFVFALCDKIGMFEELETLCQSEIIAEETEENEDGTYYLEYLDGMGQETNAYFLTKKEI